VKNQGNRSAVSFSELAICCLCFLRDHLTPVVNEATAFPLTRKRPFPMLSLEQLRQFDPEIEKLSDEELAELRDKLHPIIEKILDKCFDGEENQSCHDLRE
jgi:hypothetical protein